jgi:hypothetical protein
MYGAKFITRVALEDRFVSRHFLQADFEIFLEQKYETYFIPMKNAVLLNIKTQFAPHRNHMSPLQSPAS